MPAGIFFRARVHRAAKSYRIVGHSLSLPFPFSLSLSLKVLIKPIKNNRNDDSVY